MPNLVLVHPQIPPNTGNVARTCAATKTDLHLVKPLGFELTDRYLKRAGLDYWPYVKLHIHESLEDLMAVQQGDRWIGFTVTGQTAHHHFAFQDSDWLFFGSETNGLPAEVLERCDAKLYIPMREPGVRSLNLSVSVAVGLFECYRQIGFA